MTTSPQCFGTAPGLVAESLPADVGCSEGGDVVILTGTSSVAPDFEVEGDTGPCSVAWGWRCG